MLDRFIRDRDEAAIRLLIERHGSMVLGICRRVLGNLHDAEDAGQAVFLILVRKAASIRKRQSLASWLHGVAFHVATNSKRNLHRRRRREEVVAKESSTADDMPWREVRLALDEELGRLPERYRAPLVLCYLEGETRDEAARQLRWTLGTLRGRLERGRELLRARFIRRGLTLSAAMLAGDLAIESASASPELMALAAKALAAARMENAAADSANVAAIAQGALRSMSIPKFKIALVVVFLLTAVGAALYIHATPKAEAEPEQPPKRTAATENKPAEVPTQPIRTLSGHKDRVTSVAYSRDGRWLASAAWDGTVRLWDAASGKEIRKLDVPPPRDYRPAHISRVLFSPDGQYLIAAQQCMPNETGVIVWKRETGEKIHELRGGTGSVALSPDGKSIACGGYGVIHLHNLKSGLNIKELCGRQSHVESLAFSPDGKLLYATGPLPPPPSPDGIERTRLMPAVMRVWDIASGKECKSVLDKLQMSPLFQNNALSPDGRTLAVGAREISLREIATSVERVRFIGHVNDGEAVAFSRDGRTLASGNMDGTVRVWDLASGKELARFGEVLPKFAGRGWILCVAFSPDNRTLVAGTLDHVAQIWDVSNIMARPRALKERTPGELETDWKDLAGDSPTAFAAINRLVASPTNAVAFLEKQLQATKLVDANKVERLIADLGSEQFQTREKAMKALQLLGDLAAPALRKALAANPTAEARQRLLALLERLDGGSPGSEILRQIRAVEAQETIGNGDARRVLEKLAAGPAEARLTQEAKAALERMARRNPVGKR